MPKRAAAAVMMFGECLQQAKCRRDRRHRFLQIELDGAGLAAGKIDHCLGLAQNHAPSSRGWPRRRFVVRCVDDTLIGPQPFERGNITFYSSNAA
jgi:hypothetical protein